MRVNITCPFSAPKYADVNKTGGSILNANYPLKWVNFACLFTHFAFISRMAALDSNFLILARRMAANTLRKKDAKIDILRGLFGHLMVTETPPETTTKWPRNVCLTIGLACGHACGWKVTEGASKKDTSGLSASRKALKILRQFKAKDVTIRGLSDIWCASAELLGPSVAQTGPYGDRQLTSGSSPY